MYITFQVYSTQTHEILQIRREFFKFDHKYSICHFVANPLSKKVLNKPQKMIIESILAIIMMMDDGDQDVALQMELLDSLVQLLKFCTTLSGLITAAHIECPRIPVA